jgi:sugar transferase EpsL
MLYSVLKRTFDTTASAMLLVLLSPVMIAVALAVLVSMGPPILFRQTRPGRHGRRFVLVKFRTMRPQYDQRSESASDAERLTRTGAWLRSTSLDELPSLWNVLKGDMSLVGPRPLFVEYLGRYDATQARRHDVKPGITGWAQINGRNVLSWEERLAMDVWYVDHRSFGLDLKILLRTIGTVLSRNGISAPGHATMPEFKGNANDPS